MTEFEKQELAQLDRDAIERERIQLDKERIRLQRIQLAMQQQQTQILRRMQARSNRSWYERLEDSLFDW